MNFKFHHVGIIVHTPRLKEDYNRELKCFISGYKTSNYGIETWRFEGDSRIHPLIKSIPHIAFEVDDLEPAIADYTILEKYQGNVVSACFVEVKDLPVQFIQYHQGKQKNCFNFDQKKLIYHHFGICTNARKENMIHLPHLKLYCTDHEDNPYGLQWMKYEEDAPYPKIVKAISHVAFRVENLLDSIQDKNVIVKPNSPSDGVMVAFIEECGIPIELLQID